MIPSRICVKPASIALLSSLLALATVGCEKARTDFGTLPRVVVELDDPPPPEDIPEKKSAQPEKKIPTGDPPDPPPLSTKHQFDFVVQFKRGTISVLSHKEQLLKLKTPTARRIGRFAFELWSASTLIERVRFDFPLLGAGAPEENDALEGGLTAQTTVRVPSSDRANRARILDRKTRSSVNVPWPPRGASPLSPSAASSEAAEAQRTEAPQGSSAK